MTTCAITGAGGMVGRHLVGELLAAGVRIRALLLHGEPVPPGFDDIEIVRGDVRDRAQMATFVAGCDTVYHLAALVGRDANTASFATAREVNVNGTRNLVDAARAAAVERFVFLSTCCVYGLHGFDDSVVDETSPHAPLDLPYDVTKTEAERLVCDTGVSDLPWSVLQIPVALGGVHTVDKPTAMSLIRLARIGIAPKSNGRTSWANYVFGRDVAAALMALAQHPAAIGQTFIHSESVPLERHGVVDRRRTRRALPPGQGARHRARCGRPGEQVGGHAGKPPPLHLCQDRENAGLLAAGGAGARRPRDGAPLS